MEAFGDIDFECLLNYFASSEVECVNVELDLVVFVVMGKSSPKAVLS